GRGQYELKNYEKAIEYYGKAIEKNPEYSAAYFERGDCYHNLQKYELAIPEFDKSIEINKNWEVANDLNSAYFSRGLAYYSIEPKSNENMNFAIKDYSQYIDLNPTPNAYWNRGLAYNFLRNFDKAIADYKKWYETDNINSNRTKAGRVTQMVKCFSELGKQDEIEKWSRIGLDLLGKNVEAFDDNNNN
ncbi:MAG TPA: tetratricopeptide repeat protein, partial [Chitinophagaceae bacterium]